MELNRKLMGKRLQEARLKKSLTQEKLAELIGVSTVFISHLEIGSKTPSLETLVKICNTLEVSIDYILANTLSTSSVFLEKDIADLIKNCSTDDKNLIITIIKAISEYKKIINNI